MSAEALLAALAAIHDPTTPAPLRLQATAQCEAFKAAGIASMPVALQLCRRSSPQAGRHFGLQTIIHVVEQCWNNLSPDDKQIMCQTAVQLCQEDDTGSRFVCEMQARIIVEIACRQWPQEWPRLHEILLDLAARSQHNAIVTCSVFTGLAELVVKPTQPGRVFLPERRRLEIRQGLEACLPAVNAALGGMLQVGSREVALAAITCIAATAEWESHANLVASQILSRLSALMTSRTDLFEFAVEPLLKICSRRPPSLTDDLVAELIAVWRATVLVTSTILRSAPFPDQQRLLKIAVELLAALSRHQMQPLLDTNDVSLHHMYLALLGDLLKYPDDADVGITTLSIWLPVIKSGKLVSAEQRPALLTELLQISADRVIAGAPSTGTTDEQSRNAQRYRTSLLDMVRVVAGEAPTAAIQVAGGHCLCLLSVRGSDVAQAQSAQMMLQTVLETPAIRQILAGEAPDKDGVEALAYSLLVSLLQLHCEDTQLLIRYCSALSHFHELLGRRPDVLRLAIDKLLTINDLGSADVPDELAYQRKAICVLIGLAKRARPCAVMVQWFPTLSPAVMALCSQRPRHAAQLIEFLVAIANSLADPQQRVAYVSALIEPDLVAFQTIVSDMTSSRFMSLFGLGRVDGKVAFNIAQAKALRPQLRQILGLLASFLSILRTASVDERIWTSLLPGIVTLTTRLHELYCVRPDDMAPSANAILEVSHGDAHIQIRKMVGDQRSDVEADVDVSRAQFGSLRDRLYGLLAVVMQVRPVAVVACLPQSLSAFSIWRLQPILQKVLTPFLESHCPVEDDIFVRVFAQVVREMLNVLRVAWNRAAVPQERVSVERDVFEDNALRDLTRAVLSLIMSTVATSGWVPFAEANPAAGPSRADAALDRVASSPPILQDLFAITSLAIQCPDSHAQRSASIITCRLIPATVACGCQQMVVEMCSLVLRSLSCDVTGHPDHISVVQVALHQLALDRSSNVADLLRTIPGAVPQEVDRLVDELKGAPQSTKVLRSAVRAFLLAYVIGKQCDRANGAKIVDLDAPLVFAAKPSPTIADDDTPIVALHDLLESQT